MGDQNVCRDFTRGVCNRGANCRYSHVGPEGAANPNRSKPEFCHDFQNGNCNRQNCRFIHCQRNEEGNFMEQSNEIPVCKDFLQNQCSRTNCKYRHPDVPYAPVYPPEVPYATNYMPEQATYEVGGVDEYGVDFNGKRRRMDYAAPPPRGFQGVRGGGIAAGNVPTIMGRSQQVGQPAGGDSRQLQEDNNALRRKLEELKKQLSHLSATNELLLEQNARLRNEKMVPPQGIMIPVPGPPSQPSNVPLPDMHPPTASVPVGVQPPMVIAQEANGQPVINGVFSMP